METQIKVINASAHACNVGLNKVVRAFSRRWKRRMSAGSRSVGRLVAPTTKTRASSPTADSWIRSSVSSLCGCHLSVDIHRFMEFTAWCPQKWRSNSVVSNPSRPAPRKYLQQRIQMCAHMFRHMDGWTKITGARELTEMTMLQIISVYQQHTQASSENSLEMYRPRVNPLATAE